MNDRIKQLLELAVYGIQETIREALHVKSEDGIEITKSEIEELIETTVDTNLRLSEWHIKEALLAAVREEISIDDLLEEYNE